MSADLPPSDVERFAALATDLYRIHPAGGPLHVVLDDGNLDGQIRPYYEGWAAAELDAPYDQGWAIADLPPEAPAVTAGLGMSTRQLCDEIAEIMNGWTVEQREAAVAYWRAQDSGVMTGGMSPASPIFRLGTTPEECAENDRIAAEYLASRTTGLLAFLRARLDEENQAATAASSGPWQRYEKPGLGLPGLVYGVALPGQGSGSLVKIATACVEDAEHIALHDPARVLAEVDAKQRIIDAAERYDDPHPGQPCTNADDPWAECELHAKLQQRNVNPYVLRLLALPYVGHPDYRQEWTP